MITTAMQSLSPSYDAATREGPRGTSPEQAAKNRELVKAIKAINESQGLGSTSELRFSFDKDSGQPLIQVVDRVTNEVITQLPPEVTLRAAAVLKQLSKGERVA